MAGLEHYERAAEVVAPMERRLREEMDRVHGAEWCRRWWAGPPEFVEVPGEVNLVEILRIYTYARALDLTDWAKFRYNMLGNADHWFPGEHVAKLDWKSLGHSISRSPFAERIPAILEEAHALYHDAPVQAVEPILKVMTRVALVARGIRGTIVAYAQWLLPLLVLRILPVRIGTGFRWWQRSVAPHRRGDAASRRAAAANFMMLMGFRKAGRWGRRAELELALILFAPVYAMGVGVIQVSRFGRDVRRSHGIGRPRQWLELYALHMEQPAWLFLVEHC